VSRGAQDKEETKNVRENGNAGWVNWLVNRFFKEASNFIVFDRIWSGNSLTRRTHILNARIVMILFVLSMTLSACCGTAYNTQKGAIIGAGIGALAGQAIGHDTESTLIGTAAGTLLGAITGNAVDQRMAGYRTYQIQGGRAYADFQTSRSGGWVRVPGQWVGGRWVPAHRVWVEGP